MSYSTFGYGTAAAYPTSTAQLPQLTGPPTTSPGSTGSGSNLSPSCGGDSAGPGPGGPAVSPLSSVSRTGSGMTDPMTGQILSDSSHLAALSGYSRLGGGMAGLSSSMYPASYPASDQAAGPYPAISMENSAFYPSLTNPYTAMRAEGGAAGGGGAGGGGDWGVGAGAGTLPPSAGYYSYDHPSLTAYSYGGYGDLAARRKNATRESTATLKAWLNEHKKNPYPTKGEKIMLAIITKMTLTQVSTWFANARRRLKKENKMTWEPKNKLDDEDVDVSDDEDKDNSFCRDEKSDGEEELRREHLGHHGLGHGRDPGDKDDSKEGIPIPPSKPKIWSMAEMAVCKTPPPNSPHWNYTAAGGMVADSGLARHHPAMTAAAIRSNMFGLGREAGYPGTGCGSGEAKLLPSLQSPASGLNPSALPGSGDGLQSATETPPQTPPKLAPYPPPPHQYQQQQYPALASLHAGYDTGAEDKSMGQYTNDSINNIYNGNNSRI